MAQEKPIERRHSHHGHLNLKPISVIDQLKVKVKRRRIPKTSSFEIGAHTSNQNLNNNNNNKGSSPDPNELTNERTIVLTHSQPVISLTTTSNRNSFDENDIEDNDNINRML